MKFIIKHEMKGRMRVRLFQKRMTYEQADMLQYYLLCNESVKLAKVYDRTCDAVINYTGDREDVIRLLQEFHYQTVEVPADVLATSGREVNAQYQEKLFNKVVFHYARKWFLPYPLNACYTSVMSLKYIWKGIKCLWARKIEVPVLDATAIGVSMFRGDIGTASSVMFLLGIGEILEEWTHKKSVGDLARSMSLNISKVWLISDGQEVLVPFSSIKSGDMVRIHMGNVIPFDGTVVEGEAMVNQASLTGESVAVRKIENGEVYAGTVVEEGELTIRVREANGSSKFEKIVTMIEESEKLKSGLESKAEHLADKLVPYTLAGTGLTYLLTRNVTKALAVLMVDFSCALKLAMPISVLSAIREASSYNVTVKGGKYLEAMAEADTIVFDKTGTLTKAQPTVVDVVPFCDKTPDELLRIGACLEEHFPHSMAKAVVNAAQEKGLIHEEFHSKVEYIVAHGIASSIEGRRAIIGSAHFVFDDEGAQLESDIKEQIESQMQGLSPLYLAVDGTVVGVLGIEDPLKPGVREAIADLHALGVKHVVMLTGDSERTAERIARAAGVDEFKAELLPEDKYAYVERIKSEGRHVAMVGDGVNDSPALGLADVGLAMGGGSDIAKEVADIILTDTDLAAIVRLRRMSQGLIDRLTSSYSKVMLTNSALLALGITGMITPQTSSLLHNGSTIAYSLGNAKAYLR